MLASCDDSQNDSPTAVTGVNLNKTTLELIQWDSETLIATVEPGNATNKSVVWETSDPEIATVVDGLVEAVGPGEAIISVFTVDGDFFAECTVTVEELYVPVTGISLHETELNLIEWDTYELLFSIEPANATNKTVFWTSSDESIASVVEETGFGFVIAHTEGAVTLTATTEEGEFAAECELTVEPIDPETIIVSAVSLNKTAMALAPGETATLAAMVLPEKAVNKSVRWSSSNESVAIVEDGYVTAYAEGTAIITVTTNNGGKTAECEVTVRTIHATNVRLSPSNTMSIAALRSQSFTATVEPADATNKNVSWASSDETIATVNENGRANFLAPGTATITVTTEYGGFSASCTVTVTPIPVTGVSLNPSTMSLVVEDTDQLIAAVQPSTATNRNIIWTSSNESRATVDANGIVTAHAVGTATITATTVDGGKTATCAVTVLAAPVFVSGVTLSKASLSIYPGEYETLVPTISPADATNHHLTWASSDPAVAKVDANGDISALVPGTTTITVTTVDGGFTAACMVTVLVPVSGVTLNPATITIDKGTTEILSATVAPDNAANKNVSWESSNEAIATVDANGTVTAVAGGTAIITATTEDGNKTASCTVTVNVPASGVTVNKNNILLVLPMKAHETLHATIAPADATNKNINWSSSNNAVVTVDTNGRITAHTTGAITITATTVDGGFTATCSVEVKNSLVSVAWINPGTFYMGAPNNEPNTEGAMEQPRHQVTLTKGFYMGIYMVTQKQFKDVTGKDPSNFKGDNRPVEKISWYDTLVFCNRLSMDEGLVPVYRINNSTDPSTWGAVPTAAGNTAWEAVEMIPGANGYRLPTEAEWEYACRAGTDTAYYTGTGITTSQARYGSANTANVGTFAPNAWGLYDMHGNAQDWCWDKYVAGYSADHQTDPTGPTTASVNKRVFRGGAYGHEQKHLRSARRNNADQWFSSADDIGFRVVCGAGE